MQKRRERIEKWRSEKKKKEMESVTKDNDKEESKVKPAPKKWSLEEDESDEDEAGANGNDGDLDDDEVDPLDAYMSEVSKEVRKIKGGLNLKNAKVFKKPGPKEEGILTLIAFKVCFYCFTFRKWNS